MNASYWPLRTCGGLDRRQVVFELVQRFIPALPAHFALGDRDRLPPAGNRDFPFHIKQPIYIRHRFPGFRDVPPLHAAPPFPIDQFLS
jgi:hypothetical protein